MYSERQIERSLKIKSFNNARQTKNLNKQKRNETADFEVMIQVPDRKDITGSFYHIIVSLIYLSAALFYYEN
jgi:hypothetical protein